MTFEKCGVLVAAKKGNDYELEFGLNQNVEMLRVP